MFWFCDSVAINAYILKLAIMQHESLKGMFSFEKEYIKLGTHSYLTIDFVRYPREKNSVIIQEVGSIVSSCKTYKRSFGEITIVFTETLDKAANT